MAYCVGYHSSKSESEPKLSSEIVKQQMQTEIYDGSKICLSPSARSTVESLIRSTFPEIAITDVFEVKNTFLEGMYNLKKEEYKVMKGFVVEKQLYHVTKADYVDSIVRNNFNWRKVKRGRFGLGTSFSDNIKYANKYALKNDPSCHRAVLVCNVLVSQINSIASSAWNMKVPPNSKDTTLGNRGRVYVKFQDNEFLPRYVVYFKSSGSNLQVHDASELMRIFEALRGLSL